MVDGGSFAPDPVELELWSQEVARARSEYYVSPGPHTIQHDLRKPLYEVPWWIPAGGARTVLEEALRDLQAERHRSATLRRMITHLQRRIVDLETKTGGKNAEGDRVRSLRQRNQDDEPARDRVLLSFVRGESDERETDRRTE